jgi:putative ATPase
MALAQNKKAIVERQNCSEKHRPLADLIRPESWEAFEGVELLDRSLVRLIREEKRCPCSLIIWGPPGSGKTTLAKLVGESIEGRFVEISAVLSGVKDVREIVEAAAVESGPTLLFVDEIHRFNKSQQDAFLPHIERGTILLIGATTENPSFYLTQALLSRCRVVQLKPLSEKALREIIDRGAAHYGGAMDDAARGMILSASAGDARRALNVVELLFDCLKEGQSRTLSGVNVQETLSQSGVLLYDRNGDEHYALISAFIKSLRGSDADAALYWGFRMLESGEDPRFLLRRMMIFASEDIGNSDPRALQIALTTSEAFDRIGFPEGKIPIAQCITYLATAPKSNRSYVAMHRALEAIRRHPNAAVPLHLRNAPTGLMKELGIGMGYQYPHDAERGYVAGVEYLPTSVEGTPFYEPSERGYEKNISERLKMLKDRAQS